MSNPKLTPSQALAEIGKNKKNKSQDVVSFRRMIALYVTPIVTISVFGGMIFFLIVPAIGNIFNQLSALSQLDAEISDLNDLATKLQTLAIKSSQIDSDLQKIDKIVPEGTTEVVNFQQQISKMAESKHSLKVIEASTGEKVLKTTSTDSVTGETTLNALAVVEIPSTFTLGGSLSRIKTFIADIKSLQDFVIIGEMELRTDQQYSAEQIANLNDGNWRLTITLVKYQFQVPDAENNLAEIYKQVPETIQHNTEVLEYLRLKAGEN